jgi:fucose permease
MSPLLGALLPAYALNPHQQGTLGSVYALGLLLASLLAGPLVDLQGKRVAIVLGLAILGVALLQATRTDYLTLISVYAALGTGGGIVITAANSLAGEIAIARRASVLNFLNLFFGLGSVLTTYAASYLLRPVTLCTSIAALAGIAIAFNVFTPATKPVGQVRFRLNEIPRLLSRPALLLFSLMLFLYVACEVGVWNWLKLYLISLHFDIRTAGGIVSYGFALGMLLGRLLAMRLLVKISSANLLLACGVMMTAATYVMLQFHSRLGVTLAVFVAGLVMAPVFPTSLAMVADQFPRGSATAIGIAITSGWLGLAVSSPLIGAAAAGSSLQHALLLLPALAAAMVLVQLVLKFSLREIGSA